MQVRLATGGSSPGRACVYAVECVPNPDYGCKRSRVGGVLGAEADNATGVGFREKQSLTEFNLFHYSK